MYVFNLTEERWSKMLQKGELPGGRHSHTRVAFEGEVVIFGGMVSTMANTDQLHVMDIHSGEWKKPSVVSSPKAIDSHKACVWKNKMVVATGYSEDDYTSNIYALDL